MDSTVYWEQLMEELSQGTGKFSLSVNFGNEILVIAAYILMAIGLYAIARNRGIKHPWLAWIPVANVWILGSISDQYQYLVKGRETNRRKRLLALNIATVSLAVLMIVLTVAWVVALIASLATNPEADVLSLALGGTILILLLAVAAIGLSIWLLVETYCAYYDLFSSCVPKYKILFMVLSLVGSFFGITLVEAILVFDCRHKEEGMPPRMEELQPREEETQEEL